MTVLGYAQMNTMDKELVPYMIQETYLKPSFISTLLNKSMIN